MPTPKQLLQNVGEAIGLNVKAAELIGMELTPDILQLISTTALNVAKLNYPALLPETGQVIVRLCGESCNCPIVEYDDELSAIIKAEKQPKPESVFVEPQNKTLQ